MFLLFKLLVANAVLVALLLALLAALLRTRHALKG